MYEDIMVSIVMPVYNTREDYLRPAIESILKQTHQNLEFIIIDDCSELWCQNILGQYAKEDSRIKMIRNDNNLGITKSLNRGLKRANGQYIARMDADDISLRDRIVRQLGYLETHLEVDVLACGANVYKEGDRTFFGNDFRIDPERVGLQFAGRYRIFDSERERIHLSLANIQFTHPTVMFRKSFLDENQLQYDENLPKAQDYAMWVSCAEVGILDLMQEPLFVSRENEDMAGVTASELQRQCADETKKKCLERLVKDPSLEEVYLYTHMRDMKLYGDCMENIKLVKKLVLANKQLKVYNHRKYRQEIFFWWFRKCLYTQNIKSCVRILLNPYMIFNILRITPVMVLRHVRDNYYSAKVGKMWREELLTNIE